MDPHLTFFIRGPRGAGKSTLLNAMFAQAINAAWTDNTSSSSSSSTSSSPLTINVTKETSKNTNKKPNIFDFSFGILGNLFPLVDALKYKFIATSGSDDDSDNSALYSLYTKQSSAVILVVDKDKLECLPSQQNDLVRTVKDLQAAQIHAHVSVPLIVVVNKVDDADDSDVLEKVDSFRDFVVSYVKQQGLWSQAVEVVAMSAMNSYLYRAFLSTSSFTLMANKEVIRLCGMELGGQGKELAKDPNNYKSLEDEVRGRLQSAEAQQRWQMHCGLTSLVTAVTKSVLTEKSCFPLLQRQLSLQLDLLPPAYLPPPPPSRALEIPEIKKESPAKPKYAPNFYGFPMGYSMNPLLYSPRSPIRKVSTTALKKPLPSATSSADSMPTEARPQDAAKLTSNMVFILNLHNKYAPLVSGSGNDDEKEGSGETIGGNSGGGIDSVPSHPLYSADIETVRKNFRTSIQHNCALQYRKNFVAYLKSLPAYMEENTVTKEMALLCLNMIDTHETIDISGLRSADSWNNSRTKSIIMLLELLWSKKLDHGFFSQGLSDSTVSADREKIKQQVLVTMQILSASCTFAETHYGLTDRLVVQLFIPFIDALPNTIATMTLPSYSYQSPEDDGNSSNESDKMDTSKSDEKLGKGDGNDSDSEATENQFMKESRREIHSSSAVIDMTEADSDEKPSMKQQEVLDEGMEKPAIVLVHIERCVLALILGREEGGGEESSQASLKLIRSLVSRKIQVRDKIMGYTTCLRELLWSHSNITQKTVYSSLNRMYFSLFFPVIHCSLPQMDELWGLALASHLDYEKEIEHYPYLDSERELILRALLSKDIEDSIFINHTPCTTNLPPRSKGSSRRGGGRAVSSHNSVNSDISGTGTGASSVDDNGSRKKEKRQIAKTLLGQDVTRNASQDGDEDDDGRVKRKRRNDEDCAAIMSTPQKLTDTPSATPGSKSRSTTRTTPSRKRIIRQSGEC